LLITDGFKAAGLYRSKYMAQIDMKKKTCVWIFLFIMMGVLLIFIKGCKKEEVPVPVLTTSPVSDIKQTTAVCGGDITSDRGSTITSRGVCWRTGPNPAIADSITIDSSGVGTFISKITGLSPNTEYYVRAYATNNTGTSYGNPVTFRTQIFHRIVLTTSPVTDITDTSATCSGNIASDAGHTITARGICWSTSSRPYDSNKTANGAGVGAFTSYLTGLSPKTKYYVCAYATNSEGITVYGHIVSFKTQYSIVFNPDITYGTVTDIDENVYKTTTIGTQTWMAENLKTTKYNDGTLIPLVADNLSWNTIETGAYCWYDDDKAAYINPMGALYNWYAVNTGILCPVGWHVPSKAEWTTLIDYLGNGDDIARSMAAASGWSTYEAADTLGNDQASYNSSGFTAMPSGICLGYPTDQFVGSLGYWWSSTEQNNDWDWVWILHIPGATGSVMFYGDDKTIGCSVRCVKD